MNHNINRHINRHMKIPAQTEHEAQHRAVWLGHRSPTEAPPGAQPWPQLRGNCLPSKSPLKPGLLHGAKCRPGRVNQSPTGNSRKAHRHAEKSWYGGEPKKGRTGRPVTLRERGSMEQFQHSVGGNAG